MRKRLTGALAALALGGMNLTASAGPWEDGMAAYNRGDYLPAIQIFRPLARAGNAKAQSILGSMYHRGQGVTRSPARVFMWLKLAARGKDPKAKAELRELEASLTADEVSHARQMMQSCEASNYRDCLY